MSNIVGIGGLPRSGKDSLAELFIAAGYFGVSFGDIVRGFARERHADKPDPISVANMTETSNWLRETRGADVILQEALRQFDEKQAGGETFNGLVLYSVRAPVEADFILSHDGELIWVESTDEVRYGRAKQHQREGEADITFEEFKRQEALQSKPQSGIPSEVQMNTAYIKAKATRQLVNNGDDMTVFQTKAQQLLEDVVEKRGRS